METSWRENVLSGCSLDRVPEKRNDEEWLNHLFQDPSTRYVPIAGNRGLVHRNGAEMRWVSGPDAARLASEPEKILLGMHEGVAYVATLMPSGEGSDQFALELGADFVDLRPVASKLPVFDASIFAYARAMVHWRATHHFCGVCGSRTRIEQGGQVAKCMSPKCGKSHFPRTDSAMIVLIRHGDKALLARQASWPPGMYAAVAGFLEPGESLEDCVAREVMEETGLRLSHIAYHSSQPWPFPGSIMIGFHARAATTTLCLDTDELEDARWFTREEASKLPFAFTYSISYRLIKDWIDGLEII